MTSRFRQPIPPLDVVADELDQLSLGEGLSECRGLHRRAVATIRRIRSGDELGVPFEVAQRAQFFRFFGIFGVQRDLHELPAELATRGRGMRRR